MSKGTMFIKYIYILKQRQRSVEGGGGGGGW